MKSRIRLTNDQQAQLDELVKERYESNPEGFDVGNTVAQAVQEGIADLVTAVHVKSAIKRLGIKLKRGKRLNFSKKNEDFVPSSRKAQLAKAAQKGKVEDVSFAGLIAKVNEVVEYAEALKAKISGLTA